MLKDGDRYFYTHRKGPDAKGLPENLQVKKNYISLYILLLFQVEFDDLENDKRKKIK